MSNAFDLLLDLVFPRSCLLCSSRIQAQPLHGVCTKCLQAVGWRDVSLCDRCGVPRHARTSCSTCEQSKYVFDWVWSYGPYEGDLKRLIHAFKFENDRGIGRDLALFMTGSGILKERLAGITGLVPVPLHPLKEKNRGYNQARILAEELAKSMGVRLLDSVLIKSRPSVPQTDLGKQARWQNVSGTFTIVNPKAIRGWDLVLVDDVMTTGATTHHCAELLLKAGAKRVGVVVVARSVAE